MDSKVVAEAVLFLTDEVRLHCGWTFDPPGGVLGYLFLTDEVRLHCGNQHVVEDLVDINCFS